ncbi:MULTISPECIES: ESX secretion-associated protein EspG [Saccharothrix]|uniref:ESX secretion-associated protein EspG n=1 Tax=Saccharothrix TaxID=2071 RepID=UPI0009399966|nr:ESX secretion-associated protein EspG [Saccharothrix sp. CB00851]OKI36898.1 hypothetical protein A6A25_20605 [Saccharothrix sp. CB00851]
MDPEIDFSLAELDAVGEALRLNVRRFPFAVGHHGATREERIALVAAAHRDLVARGLIRGRDFVPELVEALHVFARGNLAIALVGTAGDTHPVALASTDGRVGVLAIQRGRSIAFRRSHPDTVVRALVGLLPAMRPGPGASVTVSDTATPAHPVDEDFSEFRFTSRMKPAAPSAVAVAAEILRRPRLGAGYFTVTARGRNDRETELGTLNYLDTDAGRYAIIPGTDHDGRLTATYTPAEQAFLDRQLTRMVDSRR